jgi:hypothetical protein
MCRRAAAVAAFAAVAFGSTVGCSGASADVGSGSSGSSGSSGTSANPPPGPPGPRDRPQSSFAGAHAGCGDMFVYRASVDGTQYVTVSIDTRSLGLSVGQSDTIDLASAPANVRVSVDVYASPPTGATYCTHAGADTGPARTTWEAEAGTLTVELRPDPAADSAAPSPRYRASVHLVRLHLVGPEQGFAAVVPDVRIDGVLVGGE